MGEPVRDTIDARRQAMLAELLVELDRRRRRRRLRRGLAALPLVAAAAAAWVLADGRRQAAPPAPADGAAPTARPAPLVKVVAGSPRTGLIRLIDDEELLARLAEIRRPAGLIRMEGRAVLMEGT